MSAVTFVVSTCRTGIRARVRVVVYDTVEELHIAAARYRGEPAAEFEDAQAISQPRHTVVVDVEGNWKRHESVGVVRLVRGQGAGVLSHEMVHMGLAIYRNDMGKASLRNMKNEETLCHIVSDLVIAANRKLWEVGAYR